MLDAGDAIGGPIDLIDQNGAEVTQDHFAEAPTLIYFGYTYCPDVCPTTLTAMGDAVAALGAKGDKVTPMFITVDPARDTVEQLKMYVGYFHPRMVGLTGSPEQIAPAASREGLSWHSGFSVLHGLLLGAFGSAEIGRAHV